MAAMIVFNLFEKEACSTYYFELNFSIAVGKNAGQARARARLRIHLLVYPRNLSAVWTRPRAAAGYLF